MADDNAHFAALHAQPYPTPDLPGWPTAPALPSVSDITLPATPTTFPPVDVAPPPAIDASRLEVDFSDKRTRIGVGTYGTVHVARYFREYVAVKRVAIPPVSPALAADPYVQRRRSDALRRFAREIRRYERVSHPGIVRFLGVATAPDAALLVTELMPGGSLSDALDALRAGRAPLQLSSFARIALQACGGLRALHAAPCTWGDAKPGNVLLSDCVDAAGHFPSCAEARISDFGLSRTVGENLLADTTIDASGQPLGTYNYMAPETFYGIDSDRSDVAKAADVYSFGLVMYEMLTLRTPWKRRKLIEVCDRVQRGDRPPWPEQGDEDYLGAVPEELKALVESCWAHDPKARPTAEEVFEALQHFTVSLNKREEAQRLVMDISGGPVVQTGLQQFASVSGNMMTRVPSKQSSASTAVAIADPSVDLQSSGINSTISGRGVEGSDDEQVMYDSLTGMGSHMSGPPRVSPVTSPEPRSLTNAAEGALSSNTHSRRDAMGSSSAGLKNVERPPPVTGNGGATKASESADVVYRRESDKNREGASDVNVRAFGPESVGAMDENAILKRYNMLSIPQEPSIEFGKHREEVELLTAAAQLADVETALSAQPPREHNQNVSLENVAFQALSVGNTIEGSVPELISSTASTASASLKRKRSKRRVLTIIEQATIALIEARRRNEAASKMPPKQRKEAADKKAIEEARILAEKEALKAIEDAQQNGGVSIILEKLKEHRDSLPVVKAGSMALELSCKKDTLYFDICEEGGIEELLSGAVRFGESDPALCATFCNSMTTLSEYYDDKVGHLIRATGVPSAVVDILEFHKTVVAVQVAGCKCLAAIAGASELSRSAVATLGGPGAVYRAMTMNNASFRDVDLARASLRAVRHIAQDNERAAEFLVQVAALDAVSRSADVFTDDGLEGDILLALRAFAFYNGGRRNIIISSGLKALTEIMLRNRNPDFLVRCCTFIREIARWRDVECEEAMLQSCIAERITTLMQMSNDMQGEEGARVSWYASQACTFLASFGSRSRQRLRLVGAIETAISILNHRRENYRVVKSATDALAELMKTEAEAKVYAERSGALLALNAALELHGGNMRVRNALQWTIDCMTSTQGANPGPAQGSQVHEELIRNGSLADGVTGNRKTRRFLGFKFAKSR